MSFSTMNKLILVVFYFLISVSAGSLPENMYRVNSCPQGKNKTAWDEASKRLKCAEDSLKKIYHCLPSIYLNETIEFCGKLVAVSEVFCPIYNYANGATVATSRKCSNFTKGCPDPPSPPFHSKDFYRYPACFEINKYDRCYYAETNCPSEEKRYEPLAVTEEEISTTPSEILCTPPVSMVKDESLSKTILIVLGVVLPVLVIAVVILVVYVVYFYRKSKNIKMPEAENEEKIPLIEESTKENERDIIYIHTSLDITDKDFAERMKNIQKFLAEILGVEQENIKLLGISLI